MRLIIISFLAVISVAAHASAIPGQTYDPLLFTVCPVGSCHSVCPAGCFAISFYISYDGEPLMADPEDVFMKIECFSGDLPLCDNYSPDAPATLAKDDYSSTPGCGRMYCWFVKGSGWCENARISLHMADDPTCFCQWDTFIRSYDVTWDGLVDHRDVMVIEKSYGEYVPHLDITCDGVIDMNDIWWSLYITPNHLGHSCSTVIGTRESSWGAIKCLYE